MFTTDGAVQSLVATILPLVVTSHFMICLTTILDGVYIGTNRVRDYVTVSVLSTAAAWGYYALVAIPRGLERAVHLLRESGAVPRDKDPGRGPLPVREEWQRAWERRKRS
jgi:hypothetical protein